MELKLEIVFSWANMSITNYLSSLMADLRTETSFASTGHLKIPAARYGKGAFISMATKTWSNTQSPFKDPMINAFSPIN